MCVVVITGNKIDKNIRFYGFGSLVEEIDKLVYK